MKIRIGLRGDKVVVLQGIPSGDMSKADAFRLAQLLVETAGDDDFSELLAKTLGHVAESKE